MAKRTKYIFVVGGVISGLGKGIAAASIAKLLQARGLKVSNIKIDAYVNIDAGTMNPIEHGEVFVTDDGMETDQDIGNYERFLGHKLSRINYFTTGQIYKSVIDRERNLGYHGKCVEVVPHIPLEVIGRIKNVAKHDKAEVVIIEIGGTVGEYQNILFLEAGRMLRFSNPKDVLFVLVSYLPIPSKLGEMKTKPTQTAAKTLNSAGIQADFILGRGEKPLDKPRKEKLSWLCNMHTEDIISAPDVDNIYKVPLNFKEEKLDEKILKKLHLKDSHKDLKDWRALIEKILGIKKKVKIAMVGKYFTTGGFTLTDSYISVIEAIKHASWENNVIPELTWIDAEQFDPTSPRFRGIKQVEELKNYDGIVVPGGFGSRGVEGIIEAIKFARVNKIPYLGLCYGMQMAVVEFARNVCNMKQANTTEIDSKTKYPVVALMDEQIKKMNAKIYGGTMRLGAYPCKITDNTLAHNAYKNITPFGKAQGKNLVIFERHRHRYEFNNEYREMLEDKGLVLSGVSPDNKLVEIIELNKKEHPFFVGVQFHPEFNSQPLKPHPLFQKFIKASLRN